MSKANFEQLHATGRVPVMPETLISPSQEYAQGYSQEYAQGYESTTVNLSARYRN